MENALNFNFAEEQVVAKMKVVGIGGAGGNAVDRMILAGIEGVEFVATNTDAQALSKCLAPRKVQIGREITKGLGAGANPEVGKKAAEQDEELLSAMLNDTNLVFITAGMGGGTGTGAAPKIAELARSKDALTVAIVTKPFLFEGRRRMCAAEEGIKSLRERVDTLVVIPNQRLLTVVDPKTSLLKSFEMADSVLTQATRGISDLIAVPGVVNLDFADVRTIMAGGGDALMGIGTSSGEGRGSKAAREAISCPLLEDVSIAGAQGILVNITGSTEMTLHEINEASSVIYEAAGDRANVIFGAVIDNSCGDEIRVTVIATGFSQSGNGKALQPDKNIDFRPTRKPDLEIPAKIRRENATAGAALSSKGVTNSNGDSKSRRYIGAVDLDAVPSDLSLPTFLRRLSS